MVSESLEGVKGQFRKGDVVYNLNDATQEPRPRDDGSDDEDCQPAKKKAKNGGCTDRKIPNKDQEIHMKVKFR